MQTIELNLEEIIKKIIKKIDLPQEYNFFSDYIKKKYIAKEISLIIFKNTVFEKSISREEMNANIYNFFLNNNITNFEENLFLLFESLKDEIIIKSLINNIIFNSLENIII